MKCPVIGCDGKLIPQFQPNIIKNKIETYYVCAKCNNIFAEDHPMLIPVVTKPRGEEE